MDTKDMSEKENYTPENEPVNGSETGTEENNDNSVKASAEIADLKDKYLRLAAEFDNFKRRTAKERITLSQTAGKEVIKDLLEVLDDCDRAQAQFDKIQDPATLKEGFLLIFSKLRNILNAKGLKAMETKGRDFNPDTEEAITEIPAPSEALKGKVLDEVEKGYYLNDAIIRFAKVVVGK